MQCVFQDFKNGTYKIISFNAKRARGLMVRFAVEMQAKTPEDLQGFNAEHWQYAPDVSSADKIVFRRDLSAV